LTPFTLPHFEEWAQRLILDNEQPWSLEPFQAAFVEDVFAGNTACWLIVPEGNGKTTLIAGLALYHIQHRVSATCPVAASTRDQAKIMFQQAQGFVFRSDLEDVFVCQEGNRRILCGSMGSEIKVFAADAGGADGVIPTMAFVDELHRHKNLSLYQTWLGKMNKRGGQLIVISTAGEAGGEFELERTRFRQTADAVDIDGPFTRAVNSKARAVLHEWALPESADPEDLGAVANANPFSGVTPDTLFEKRLLPGMTAQHWLRFTCNRASRSDAAAITEPEWHAAGTDERIPEGAEIWAGLDVGWRHDTTSIAPLWWRDEHFRLLGDPIILVPPRDGSSLHPNLIKRAFEDLVARYRLTTVVMDSNRAEDIAAWLSDELDLHVIERAQTSKPQAEDYERFMEALRQGWLKHTGDVGLRQHALNAIAYNLPDGGAKFRRISETRIGGNQDSRVIDALIAAAMVHSVRSEAKPSFRVVAF
jgi:phage terminase large subunit-like protein